MEKREPQCIIGRNVSGYSHDGIYDGGFSKTKNRSTIWNNNLTPVLYPKDLKAGSWDISHPSSLEVLCTITKRGKQSTPSLDEKHLNEVWYIQTMEHYSSLQKEGNPFEDWISINLYILHFIHVFIYFCWILLSKLLGYSQEYRPANIPVFDFWETPSYSIICIPANIHWGSHFLHSNQHLILVLGNSYSQRDNRVGVIVIFICISLIVDDAERLHMLSWSFIYGEIFKYSFACFKLNCFQMLYSLFLLLPCSPFSRCSALF